MALRDTAGRGTSRGSRAIVAALVGTLGAASPVAAAPGERVYDGPTAAIPEAGEPGEPAAQQATDHDGPHSHHTHPPPAPRPRRPESTDKQDAEELPVRTPSRFVVANYYGFAFGPPRFQIVGVTLFLGASLPRITRPGNFTAIGLQGEYSPYAPYHQHLTVHGVGGEQSGLMYSFGAGLVIHRFGEHLTGGEAEVRVGYVFTRRQGARVRGVLGAMGRAGMVSMRFDEGDRPVRVLQIGLFVGFTRAPVGSRGRVDETQKAPPRGLGFLVPGIVLLAGVAGTLVFDLVYLAGSAASEGCHGCIPLTVYALPALVPGIPLTIAGAIRLRRYRQWKQGITFTPRLTGLSMHF